MAARTPSGPAGRQAFGVVAPFDMELDGELWRWLPSDVDLLMTRTPFVDDGVTVEFVQELSDADALGAAVRSVTAGRADVVTYACTSASFVGGLSGEAQIRENMIAAGASEAFTTSGSLIAALRALDIERVSLATPYLPEVSAYLDTFLAEAGVATVRHESLGLDREIWAVKYKRTAALIRAVDHPEAQAIFVSCTNLPTYDLIAPLEEELGKPILSANQVTMWAALQALGHHPVGPGQALVEANARPEAAEVAQ